MTWTGRCRPAGLTSATVCGRRRLGRWLSAVTWTGRCRSRTRADAGDGYAAEQLAGLLSNCGDLDGAAQILRARADVGDQFAAPAAGWAAG